MESAPGASLLDLPHHRMDLIMHTELKGQVDELSLNVKQQCIVLISIHFFGNKFWSYIVTKDMSQIKNVIIYGRLISKHSMNSVMGESSIIHIINFPSLPVKQRSVITQTFLARRSLHITITKTSQLPCAFRLVHLIISFDRGHIYR